MAQQIKRKKSSGLPGITQEFLHDNQKLVKIMSKSRNKKGGPYNKKDRDARRTEVYRLYYEYGYSAKKISELMKINRNTINGDVDYLHSKIVKLVDVSNAKFWVSEQIERLGSQRTRLREYLDETKNLQEKLAIERMIFDVESKIGQIELKLLNSKERAHIIANDWLNKWMEKNNQEERYISYGDMMTVPSKSYEKICRLLKNISKC